MSDNQAPQEESAPAPLSAAQRLLELKKKLLSGKPASTPPPESSPLAPKPLTRAMTPLAPIRLVESPPLGGAAKESTPAAVSGGTSLAGSEPTSSSKPAKKQPLTLKSLLGSKYASKRKSGGEAKPVEEPVPESAKSTPKISPVAAPPAAPFSRLKEAPALRKMAQTSTEESTGKKPKLISLTGSVVPTASPEHPKSVADVIAKFEENPPASLLASSRVAHPFGAPERQIEIPPDPLTGVAVKSFLRQKRNWIKRNRPAGFAESSISTDLPVAEFIAQHRQYLSQAVSH